VRYPETDRMGVAYHAHYLVWFELGRTELMRELGCVYGELEERDGIAFPVIEASARYHAPARYDQLLEVTTRVAAVGGSRIRFEYRIERPADARMLASGFTEHAAVGRDGRPRRLPAALRERLASLESGR
jgi:acyl-CoA thioester hydrolase